MKKVFYKWIFLAVTLLLWVFALSQNKTYAQDVDWFNIIPKLEGGEIAELNANIKEIWSEWWYVRAHYNDVADRHDENPKKQIASWIMSWNTILNYLVFVVQFLSQLWLLVWVMFIMYAWYKYMVSVFAGWKTNNAPEMLKNAIIWVIIVIFSYAIMKTLTSFIWIS